MLDSIFQFSQQTFSIGVWKLLLVETLNKNRRLNFNGLENPNKHHFKLNEKWLFDLIERKKESRRVKFCEQQNLWIKERGNNTPMNFPTHIIKHNQKGAKGHYACYKQVTL